MLVLMYLLTVPGCRDEKGVPAVVVRVIDGDTIVAEVGGEDERIRLIGVDAPESRANNKAYKDAYLNNEKLEIELEQGRRSSAFVKSLLQKGDRIRLEYDVQERDQYHRLLAYVYLSDGRMLNEVLLKEGYANLMTVPPNVKHVDELIEAQHHGRQQ
jgi:micrococcal nuclease